MFDFLSLTVIDLNIGFKKPKTKFNRIEYYIEKLIFLGK